MWQVRCASLDPAAFILPTAGPASVLLILTLLMGTPHIWAGIAHICLIFAPNSNFRRATSIFGLCCELWTSASWFSGGTSAYNAKSDNWRRHWSLLSPNPFPPVSSHVLHGFLSHERQLKVYNLVKLVRDDRRLACLHYPVSEWRFFTSPRQTKHVLYGFRLLNLLWENIGCYVTLRYASNLNTDACCFTRSMT